MTNPANTLYVTTQGCYVRKDHQTVVVSEGEQTLFCAPLHALDGIICFGNVGVSPFLMHACAEQGIAVSFLSENGKFLARVEGPASGNVLLRREQYRRADDPIACRELARACVGGKLANYRTCLRRFAREHTESEKSASLDASAERLRACLRSLPGAGTVAEIRGREGEGSAEWFSVFDAMLHGDPEAFSFEKRSRRPPRNPVNALLSFLYSLLLSDCSSALQAVGLDPAVGFLHTDRPGRLSLALDLMEEFRPVLADRFAIALINQRQIRGAGFSKQETGAVVMDEETRKAVLVAWPKRKKEEITHPFTGEKTRLGLLPLVQARLLARSMRGDLEVYPPFTLR